MPRDRCRWIGYFTMIVTALTAVNPTAINADAPEMELVLVPASEHQPDGPTHDYRLGRYEVTNAQYVAFLNDALANLNNERGHYMFFDSATGDVLIHTSTDGQVGQPLPGMEVKMFAPSASGQITFENNEYRALLEPFDYTNHPVTGVSWYGAIKFCNWMTLATGLDTSERAYSEGPADDLSSWRPVTISSAAWTVRDLNEQEREGLLMFLGYRLPMDGGIAVDGANPFNEWYKAAAWDGQLAINYLYGFGRDTITAGDANFRCTLDPYENSMMCALGGTTPVGYYDGTNHGGSFATNANANYFGLFDLSGNTWEWMQDRTTDSSNRRNRGGSHTSIDDSLEVLLGAERAANAIVDSTGFRVAQSALNQFFVTPVTDFVTTGPWGGALEPMDETIYCLTNLTDAPIQFTMSVDANWVSLSAPQGTMILAEGTAVVEALISPSCEAPLPTGSSIATVSFEDLTNQVIIQRRIRLNVIEPLAFDPLDELVLEMPYGGNPSVMEQSYTVYNDSETAVQWSASWQLLSALMPSVDWIVLSHDSGVAAPEQESFALTMTLHVEDLPAGVHEAEVIFTDVCTGTRFVRLISLTIHPPFAVSSPTSLTSEGVCGGPFMPGEHAITLTNLRNISSPWTSAVSSPVSSFISLTPSEGILTPFGQVNVTASVNDLADLLAVDSYLTMLHFFEPSVDFDAPIDFELNVEGVQVDPENTGGFEGALAGPFEPEALTYTISNTGVTEMNWAATFVDMSIPPASTWLTVSPSEGIILNPDGVVEIAAYPNDYALTLPPGDYSGNIEFGAASANGCPSIRHVTLTVGTEGFRLDTAIVSADEIQPGGPNYLFRISRYEVTNRQFARFLNDARDNSDNPRGSFMAFDLMTGQVRLPSDATLLFQPQPEDGIYFDGSNYLLENGREQHPATGVTWFGALKFCNWLTVVQGMTVPDQRAYHEGDTREQWYPITTDHALYLSSDLVVSQREALVNSVRGYRLPMDGGTTGPSAFNEWYKAAAWNDAIDSNSLYGFGRNVLMQDDANFLASCDPFELLGTTPVGFYDGSHFLDDACGATTGTTNGYGLYDVTGNVAEWVQDFGTAAVERATRGGHYDNVADSPSLLTVTRTARPADGAYPFVGFRVAQALTAAAIELSREPARIVGFAGGPYDADSYHVSVVNDNDYSNDDLVVMADRPWLDVEGVAPHVLPPHSTSMVSYSASTDPLVVGVSPLPPAAFALVAADERQPDGPMYDFWIGKTEVTNSEYVLFLNDARADVLAMSPSARSEHMYFDLDSGSVFINDQVSGQEGSAAPSGSVYTFMYDASVGRIDFVEDVFVPGPGYADHPVVGVTWYGALKYCNWLTIVSGLPASLRAYGEAASPNLSGWRPMTVDEANWLAGPLSDGQRAQFVRDTLGYRLPMDGNSPTASAFNEWYEAAAWDPGRAVNHVYGFGRDVLLHVDANFFDSNDTMLNGTSPVAFFNGLSSLYVDPLLCHQFPRQPIVTLASDNSYGMNDLCGNVAEWIQEVGVDTSSRVVRGGSWRAPVDSTFLTNVGRNFLPADGAFDDVGFRVVRGSGHVGTVTVADHIADSLESVHVILEVREPFDWLPTTNQEYSAIYGESMAGLGTIYDLSNRSDMAMDWSATSSEPWLLVSEMTSGESAGSIVAAGSIALRVQTNELANELTPGTHGAQITIDNEITGSQLSRRFSLTVGHPATWIANQIDPQIFSGYWQGPFHTPISERSFSLVSHVGFPINYTISANQCWLFIEPSAALTGMLAGGQTRGFTVTIAENANELQPGGYSTEVSIHLSRPGDPEQSWQLDETLSLHVNDPLTITPDTIWEVGADLDPQMLPMNHYILANNGPGSIDVDVSVDVDWLVPGNDFLEIPSGSQQLLDVSLDEAALALAHGEHVGRVLFSTGSTAFQQCRRVTLRVIQPLTIEPFAPLEAAGIAGGPITPIGKTYSLSHAADDSAPIIWTAFIQPADATWLRLNGASSAVGILTLGATTDVLVTIDPAQTLTLADGQHHATIMFNNITHNEISQRQASLDIVTPAFSLDQAAIPVTTVQPAGPTYGYRMARFHTTNAQFVAFLNDALINLDNERGQYMYFDLSTGDVFVNISIDGEVGTGANGRTTKLFAPNAAAQIAFAGVTYEVVTEPDDFGEHPVTGVSWYGAIKYTNWLTIDQGMPPHQRCCTEDSQSNLAGWHPITISTSDWVNRDLNDLERMELVANCLGFRLPMDDGHNNVTPGNDSADNFNEWYKAAAWNSLANQNTLYGFGRNMLTGIDANFRASGDPFDDGSTPVGYYGGQNQDPSFPTTSNANGFEIYDMTANAYQWILGRFNNHPNSIAFRTLRGGSWNDVPTAAALRTNSRTFTTPALTDSLVGFRVARTIAAATGDANGDGDSDIGDFATGLGCLTGPSSSTSALCAFFDYDGDTDIDLRDFAQFENAFEP